MTKKREDYAKIKALGKALGQFIFYCVRLIGRLIVIGAKGIIWLSERKNQKKD